MKVELDKGKIFKMEGRMQLRPAHKDGYVIF